MAKELTLTGFNWKEREAMLRISADTYNKWATVVVYAGCATVQCYATVDELRAIAHAATLAADELEIAALEAA
jgi:hypothetical protein